ncbi:hypothetical protein BCV71DRAFT_50335 [Rhizopus microsporus]|uniref:Uncharacterized protein n=1 Tax=Rhizopus microsporus TaxID=58291 RepID=A0A1X0RRK4_RHIZD|nr:hypothetical protein BCV71DRAFT_50335 [Rhizopus microsporus]
MLQAYILLFRSFIRVFLYCICVSCMFPCLQYFSFQMCSLILFTAATSFFNDLLAVDFIIQKFRGI